MSSGNEGILVKIGGPPFACVSGCSLSKLTIDMVYSYLVIRE